MGGWHGLKEQHEGALRSGTVLYLTCGGYTKLHVTKLHRSIHTEMDACKTFEI